MALPLEPALAPSGAVASPMPEASSGRAAARAPAARRLLKHPRTAPYQRLILAVGLVNAGVLWAHLERGDWLIDDGSALSALAALTLVNFTAAVLIRQQNVLNVLFGLAGRGSRSWPLWLRWSVSKVHHVGGIHAGGALAGTAWLCAFTAVATVARARHPASVSTTTLVLAYCLVALAVLVVVCAAPPVRSRAHNVFELSHRFGGWTAIALFWALTVHLALRGRGDAGAVAGDRVGLARLGARDPDGERRLALAAVAAGPGDRRAPVVARRRRALRLRRHARVRVGGRHQPQPAARVARVRDGEHARADPGYRLLISRAGDWTGRFIDDPPSHVWVRGTPTSAPMAKVALLYERVVYVVTGSGIGPCLGQILAARVPARLVWSTRDPRATYGDALVDEVEAAQPDAVIWDTTQRGKPDLVQLAREACRDFDAEAVFVVSNKATTLRLVHELERLGIPAFGPIWDS